MNPIIAKAEKYVTSLLRTQLPHLYTYHSLRHTQEVVRSTKELIEGENVNEIDSENLIIAAWFHDVGFTKGHENHEEKSKEIAATFLKQNEVSDERIVEITNLILATKVEYKPRNLSEKVIRDADCAHFKGKRFSEISALLRNEWKVTSQKTFTDIHWTKENISFLTKQHQFYTNFAIKNWQKGKDENVALLFKALLKQE